MAKFTTLSKDEMIKLIWKMLYVNHDIALANMRESFDGTKWSIYNYNKIRKIFSMCCDWNSAHDEEGVEIYMDEYLEKDEDGSTVVRIYVEDDNIVFPET